MKRLCARILLSAQAPSLPLRPPEITLQPPYLYLRDLEGHRERPFALRSEAMESREPSLRDALRGSKQGVATVAWRRRAPGMTCIFIP